MDKYKTSDPVEINYRTEIIFRTSELEFYPFLISRSRNTNKPIHVKKLNLRISLSNSARKKLPSTLPPSFLVDIIIFFIDYKVLTTFTMRIFKIKYFSFLSFFPVYLLFIVHFISIHFTSLPKMSKRSSKDVQKGCSKKFKDVQKKLKSCSKVEQLESKIFP